MRQAVGTSWGTRQDRLWGRGGERGGTDCGERGGTVLMVMTLISPAAHPQTCGASVVALEMRMLGICPEKDPGTRPLAAGFIENVPEARRKH